MLRDYIESWKSRITAPRPEFGMKPPCPYAHLATLCCVSCDSVQELEPLMGMLGRISMKQVLIMEFPLHCAKEVRKTVANTKEMLAKADIIALISDPSRPVIIDGYQTSQSEKLLVIFQNKSELERLSEHLKHTDYYDKWDKDTLAALR